MVRKLNRIRVLFNVFADVDNTNAQSLNARDLALRLDPKRFTSTLFVTSRPDPRLLNRPGVRLIRLPRRLRSLVIAPHLVWGPYDILFYPPLDHLLVWYNLASWLGTPKAIVMTVEGMAQQIEALPPKIMDRFLKLLRTADATYAISPFVAETVLREFGMTIGSIPIGVDTSLFAPTDRAGRQEPAKVLCVASIQPHKQIHLLLDLARRIPAQRAEFHVIGDAIGSTSYRDALLKRKQEENLRHVSFHGRLSQPEVSQWMRACDIFVLPSQLEGTPKVTLEAAATGLPCIVFRDYGTPSVLDGVTGFQVKDLDEMTERLWLLLNDDEFRLRLGLAAIRHIQSFNWDAVTKQWEEAFEAAVGAKT